MIDIEWRDYEHERSSMVCVESDFKDILNSDILFYKSPAILNGYKHEVRSVLGIECKNLWYQDFFFVEKVIAFSLWLSQTYKDNKYVSVSNRESIKRAWNAYYSFNEIKHDYKQRLSSGDRKIAYSNRNKIVKTKPFKDEVLTLIKEGVSNKEIMNKYSVTRMTLSRWKKQSIQ